MSHLQRGRDLDNHDPLLDFDFEAGRLRFGDVDMSKQSYRDGTATLPEIKKRFDEVAVLTDRFVSLS